MHGRVKTRSTAEQQEIKRKEREKKVKLYTASVQKLLQKREENVLDNEVLDISWQLLSANPDIYTVWNIRRQVLLNLKNEKSTEELQQLLQNELSLTEQCLRNNPKSYYAWHQRRWALSAMPNPNWRQELALCNKYLELDERNFHTWNYRQYIVAKAKFPAEDEFAFSTYKISSNFSNYSSWHYRSRLLALMFPDPLGKRPVREDKHKEELSLVQNATFTDPNDQSAWFYQRWLLGRSRQPLALAQAFISECLTFAALTKSVRLGTGGSQSPLLELHKAGAPVKGTWKPSHGAVDSCVWIFVPEDRLCLGDWATEGAAVEVVLLEGGQQTDRLHLYLQGTAEAWGSRRPQFDAQFSQGLTSVLEHELEAYCQLLELEPDSKWTLLTIVLLMQAIDRHRYKDDTMQKITHLKRIDPLRSGYYQDLRSRYEMEYILDEQEERSPSRVDADLSGHCLSALYHLQFLSLLQRIDLSRNQLTERSLPALRSLQCCQELLLDDNLLDSLVGLPSLPRLQVLSLQNNRIASRHQVQPVKACQCLWAVLLAGNPVAQDDGFSDFIRQLLPQLQS